MVETILKMKYNKEYNAFNIKNIYIRYKYCLNSLACLLNFSKSKSNRSVFDAVAIRNTFKDYFNSCEGSLSWQLDYVQSCGRNPVSN